MELNYNGKSLKSGIYKITNKVNGRVYIGSAKEFKSRWKNHAWSLINSKHRNKFLQADYIKCGAAAFKFDVLEITSGTKEERLVIEEKYLNIYFDHGKQCYNLTDKAISREGFPSKDPAVTSRKMSESLKASWARSKANGERIVTDATKVKLSAKLKAHWASKNPEEKALSLPPNLTGRKQSHDEVTKRVAALRANGTYDKVKSPERRALNSKQKSKIFEPVDITSPEGVCYSAITDLKAFAEEHGLRYRSLYESYRLKRQVIKGWSVGFEWVAEPVKPSIEERRLKKLAYKRMKYAQSKQIIDTI